MQPQKITTLLKAYSIFIAESKAVNENFVFSFTYFFTILHFAVHPMRLDMSTSITVLTVIEHITIDLENAKLD